MSVSLQAPAVVAAVLTDLEGVIARLPEDQDGSGVSMATADGLPSDFDGTARPIQSGKQGYSQVVDYERWETAARALGAQPELEPAVRRTV